MTPYVLVTLGGAIGTGVHWLAVTDPRWAPERVVLATNLVTSGLLGMMLAISPGPTVLNLVGLGFLAASAPFTALGLAARDVQGRHRARRMVLGIAANVIASAAAALLGLLSVRFGITLYHKLF